MIVLALLWIILILLLVMLRGIKQRAEGRPVSWW